MRNLAGALWCAGAVCTFLWACDSATDAPPRVAARVVLTPASPWIPSGGTVRLTAAVLDSAGDTIPNQRITFESSDNSIVGVDSTGLVTSIGPLGAAIILAHHDSLVGYDPVGVHDPAIDARLTLLYRPYGVAISPGGIAYVTQLDNQRLSRIDLPTVAIADTVAVGHVPSYVAFNGAGTKAFVTNQFSGNVSVIDVGSNTLAMGFTVPGDPFVLLVAPGDTLLYVTSNVDSLFAIRIATGAIVARLSTSHVANALAVRDTLLYASNHWLGQVLEINLKTNAVLRTLNLGGTVQGVVITPNGQDLYVANESGYLQHWNLGSGLPVDSVALGGPGFGLVRNPANGLLYVTVMSGSVVVIDPGVPAIVKTFATLGDPRRIAFNASGTIALVANQGGWVDVIH